MSSAYRFIFMEIKLILIRMVSRLDSFRKKGTRELGNSLFKPHSTYRADMHPFCPLQRVVVGEGWGVSGTVHEPKRYGTTVHGDKNFVVPHYENKNARYTLFNDLFSYIRHSV